MELIVLYFRIPIIGSMVVFGKETTMSDLEGLIGACMGHDGVYGVRVVVALTR